MVSVQPSEDTHRSMVCMYIYRDKSIEISVQNFLFYFFNLFNFKNKPIQNLFSRFEPFDYAS